MEKAGHHCAGFIEIDKFARKSYQAIFNTENEWTAKDIKKIDPKTIPYVNVWCFGFPCQDLSVAGPRKGIKQGAKSSLFFAVTKLLKQIDPKNRPEFLFIENVKNLLFINNGWDFFRVQIELDEIGYELEWDLLNSATVVPQHRERLYIIAHLRNAGTKKVFPITDKNRKTTTLTYSLNTIIKNKPQIIKNNEASKIAIPIMSPFQEKVWQKGRRYKTSGEPMFTLIVHDIHGVIQLTEDGKITIRRLTPLECWRLQGFTLEQFQRAQNMGLSDTQLYKQAGNAVTVPIIYKIAKKLGEAI